MDKKKRKSIMTSSNKHLKPILYHENLLSKLKTNESEKTIITYLGRSHIANFDRIFVWIVDSSFSYYRCLAGSISPFVCQKTSCELSIYLSLSLLINSFFASFTPL